MNADESRRAVLAHLDGCTPCHGTGAVVQQRGAIDRLWRCQVGAPLVAAWLRRDRAEAVATDAVAAWR